MINLQALGEYGPAGLVFQGAEYDRTERRQLGESMDHLALSIYRLRKKHFHLWRVLVEPYLADPSDPSLVDHWRIKAGEAEERRKKLHKQGLNPPKSQLQMDVEAHDKAVEWLADDLPDDLFVVHARRMSRNEEKEMEDANAAIVASYQRLKCGGLKSRAAMEQVKDDFGLESTELIERLLEFRHKIKRDVCMEEGCERTPFAQHLCEKHYRRQYRERIKRTKREGMRHEQSEEEEEEVAS